MTDAEIVESVMGNYAYQHSMTDGGYYYVVLDKEVQAEFDKRLRERAESEEREKETILQTFNIGDDVEWTGGTKTVGPWKDVAIKDGDVRKIIGLSEDGTLATLSGRDGQGMYGSTSTKNFKKFDPNSLTRPGT